MPLLQRDIEGQTPTQAGPRGIEKILGGSSLMKILLFKGTQIEPFKIYQHPEDVTLCNDGKVSINETGNPGLFEFIHLQTELIACDDQVELCLLVFVEEKSQ